MKHLLLLKKKNVFCEPDILSIENIAVENFLKLNINNKKKVLNTIKKLLNTQSETVSVENADKYYLDLIKSHPELDIYCKYFSNAKQNNAYLVIMKQVVYYYIVHLSKTYKITSYVYGKILNLERSTITHYKKMPVEKRHPEWNEVSEITDKMIKEKKYPVVNNSKGILTWTKYE